MTMIMMMNKKRRKNRKEKKGSNKKEEYREKEEKSSPCGASWWGNPSEARFIFCLSSHVTIWVNQCQKDERFMKGEMEGRFMDEE